MFIALRIFKSLYLWTYYTLVILTLLGCFIVFACLPSFKRMLLPLKTCRHIRSKCYSVYSPDTQKLGRPSANHKPVTGDRTLLLPVQLGKGSVLKKEASCTWSQASAVVSVGIMALLSAFSGGSCNCQKCLPLTGYKLPPNKSLGLPHLNHWCFQPQHGWCSHRSDRAKWTISNTHVRTSHSLICTISSSRKGSHSRIHFKHFPFTLTPMK